MLKDPQRKLVDYYFGVIDGWELMSWAANVDTDTIGDREALNEIINLNSDNLDGQHEKVKNLLKRTSPKDELKSLGEVLILGSVEDLHSKAISSSKFVERFLDVFYNEIDEANESCADWIHKVFNENNAYGFIGMKKMSQFDLITYIQQEIDNKT